MSTGSYQPRGDELTAWASVLAGARRGEGRALTVSAPAGFGKSTLLDLLATRADRGAFRVLRTSGRLLDRDVPHSGTRQLLETVTLGDPRVLGGAAALARPLLSGGSSSADAFAVQHALFWCLSNLAADGPLAVVVDDCQWLDPPTASLVGYLVERRKDLPVAIAVAGRPHAFDDDRVHRNVWSRSDVRIQLDPLSDEQIVSAIATVSPALAAAEVETIVSLSAGNPFLVAEMLRGSVDGIAPSRDADVTAVVRDYVRARISELSPGTRKLLLAAGVLGDGEPWALAGKIAGLDPHAAVSARAELTDSALIEKDENQIRFRHALLWESALSAFPAELRAVTHRQVGLALATAGRLAEASAHLLRSEPAGDARVVAVLFQQAQVERDRGNPATSVALLRRALAEPPDAERRVDVVLALGDDLLITGEAEEAARLLARAVEEATDEKRVAAARTAARALLFSGDPKAGALLLESVAQALPPESAAGEEILAEVSAIDRTEHSRAAVAASTVSEIAVGAGLGRRAAAAMNAYDHVVVWEGTSIEQVNLLGSVLDEVVDELGSEAPLVALLINGLVAAGGEGWETAQRVIEATEATARTQGSSLGIAVACTQRSRLNNLAGNLREAEADAELAVELAARANDMLLPFSVASMVMSRTLQGRLDAADEALRMHGFHTGEVPATALGANLLLARQMLRREQGRYDEAVADLHRLAPFARGQAPWPTSWTPEAVQTLRAAGQAEEAARIARAHRNVAESWGAPLHRAEAALLEATFDRDTAAEAAEYALEALGQVPAQLTRARALYTLGAARRRANARSEAKDLLLEALETATHTAAEPLVAAIREELAAAGVRPRRSERTGVAALTPSELRIVRLAAQGMTNPEIAQELFVSPKTVENHLGNAYSKLAVASRKELRHLKLASLTGEVERP